MIHMRTFLALGLLTLGTTLHAASFAFTEDPFANAVLTPGRDIVGGPGLEIGFDPATDVLAFDFSVFGVSELSFANSLAADMPSTGVNVAVVQDTAAMFGAGAAANLLAAQFEDPGPGFFIYFNTNLQVARLVYSTDLSEATSDLAILARLTNFSGASGLQSLPTIGAANFAPVPEPSTAILTCIGALLTCGVVLRRRRLHA